MTEAQERNYPDGAVSRVSLLPVVCSNRVSLRKPTLILTLQFKIKFISFGTHSLLQLFASPGTAEAKELGSAA